MSIVEQMVVQELVDLFEGQDDFRLIDSVTKVICSEERKVKIDGVEVPLYEPVGITMPAYEAMGEKCKTKMANNKILLVYGIGFVIGTTKNLIGDPNWERGYWVLDIYQGEIIGVKKARNGTCIHTGRVGFGDFERILKEHNE
jgi:hypothetical protein